MSTEDYPLNYEDVVFVPTSIAFLLANIPSYAAGINFLRDNPELRPKARHRQYAWTSAEVEALQNAYWFKDIKKPKGIIDSIIARTCA